MLMYKLDITPQQLITIMEANKEKPKEALTEQFTKAIYEAMNNGKNYADVDVPLHDYWCCNNTDNVIDEFVKKGYKCSRVQNEHFNDVIRIRW